MTMPEFDVRLTREIYTDVTIVADDADAAMTIAVSAGYELPPEDMWTVASGGEVTVHHEGDTEAIHGSWTIARIIPPAYPQPVLDSEPPSAQVTELTPADFTIQHGTDGTERVVLHAWPGWKLEEEAEFIIPASALAQILGRGIKLAEDGERVLVITSDEVEYPARIEPSAIDGTWIVLE
jgi:hypothetical protein